MGTAVEYRPQLAAGSSPQRAASGAFGGIGGGDAGVGGRLSRSASVTFYGRHPTGPCPVPTQPRLLRRRLGVDDSHPPETVRAPVEHALRTHRGRGAATGETLTTRLGRCHHRPGDAVRPRHTGKLVSTGPIKGRDPRGVPPEQAPYSGRRRLITRVAWVARGPLPRRKDGQRRDLTGRIAAYFPPLRAHSQSAGALIGAAN